MFFTPTRDHPMQHFTADLRTAIHRPGMRTKVPQAILFFLNCVGHFHSKKNRCTLKLTRSHTKTVVFCPTCPDPIFFGGFPDRPPQSFCQSELTVICEMWVVGFHSSPLCRPTLLSKKHFFTNSGPLFITGTPGSQLGLFLSPLNLSFTCSLTQKLVLYEMLSDYQILPHLHGKFIAPYLLLSWTEFGNR